MFCQLRRVAVIGNRLSLSVITGFDFTCLTYSSGPWQNRLFDGDELDVGDGTLMMGRLEKLTRIEMELLKSGTLIDMWHEKGGVKGLNHKGIHKKQK